MRDLLLAPLYLWASNRSHPICAVESCCLVCLLVSGCFACHRSVFTQLLSFAGPFDPLLTPQHQKESKSTTHTIRSEKTNISFTMSSQTQRASPIVRYFASWYRSTSQDLGFRLGVRILQFALAVTTMVLYSRDLRAFTAANVHAPPAWIYAEVVAALSIMVCIWCAFVNVKYHTLRLSLDFAIAILWASQAGYFGKLYWADDGLGNKDRPELANEKKMNHAVTVGLVCLGLWMFSFCQSVVWRCQAIKQSWRNRKAKKEAKRQMLGADNPMIESRGSLEPVLRDNRSFNVTSEDQNGDVEEQLEQSPPIHEPWLDEKRQQSEWIAGLESNDRTGETHREESQNPPPAYSQ